MEKQKSNCQIEKQMPFWRIIKSNQKNGKMFLFFAVVWEESFICFFTFIFARGVQFFMLSFYHDNNLKTFQCTF